MAGWLVRSIGSLIIVASIGAVGGSINYLNNKNEKIELPTIEEPKIQQQQQEEVQPKTVKVLKGSNICKWLNSQIPADTRRWKEESCKRFAENKLKVKFKY